MVFFIVHVRDRSTWLNLVRFFFWFFLAFCYLPAKVPPMADEMKLVITARKTVPDRDTARAIYDLVKSRFTDRPDITITGHVTNHFDLEEPT